MTIIMQITAPQAQKRCCFIAVTPLNALECLIIVAETVGVCRCQNGRGVAVSDIFLYWPGVMPYSRLNAALNWLICKFGGLCYRAATRLVYTCHLARNIKCRGAWTWPPPHFL